MPSDATGVRQRTWTGKRVDDTSESHENKKCKYNSRDDNTLVVTTERCACMPRGSRDPATEEQPRENNDVGGTNNIFLQRHHFASGDTFTRHERVDSLAAVNVSKSRTA